MGQSPSTSNRHDNASTRTLHSTSIQSNRPRSFFRRISHRLHNTHPARRFSRPREDMAIYSGSSTTSSVRRATQEATRAAVAVTGPPTANSRTPPSILRHLPSEQSNDEGGELEQRGGHSFLRYLQTPPSRTQETSHEASSTTTSTSQRRMHILLVEYRPHTNTPHQNNYISDNLPRFMRLRRPRSQVSTSSSTDTIQSMPLSMNSQNRTPSLSSSHHPQSEGQWIVYVLNSNQLFPTSLTEDNPTYEDLLLLSQMLGPVRPPTTTQAAVDEGIPVTDWSDDTKNSLKDDQCLVCLDEFVTKQPVRILKCQHVFHRECVDRWLCEGHNSCPVCRGIPV
ncbi:hypothetical protein BDB01DRAFT_575783 [Pilobolus umbonatus]|nr:hypothetical protein BDB01DRAFT_575783 [Pilobolus umbonatus]